MIVLVVPYCILLCYILLLCLRNLFLFVVYFLFAVLVPPPMKDRKGTDPDGGEGGEELGGAGVGVGNHNKDK